MVTAKKPRIEVTATITSKSQITLPKAVRERLGLKPGDKVVFEEDDTGIRVRRPSRREALEKWAGARPDPLGLTTDEFIAEARGRDRFA
jgi:antitoxin PrlF